MTNPLRSIRRGPDRPERVVVLLPGYGDRPEPFLDRAAQFDPDGRWLVVVVEPQHPSDRGPFWYDVDDNGPNPVDLAAAIAATDALCGTLLAETDRTPDDLVIAGFSQGGAIALAHFVDPTAAVQPSAVATLSGYLPTRDDTLIDLTRATHRPVLFVHGEDDDLVEPVRGRSAARAIHRSGGLVSWHEVSGGHRFDLPITSKLALWLDALARGDQPHSPPI